MAITLLLFRWFNISNLVKELGLRDYSRGRSMANPGSIKDAVMCTQLHSGYVRLNNRKNGYGIQAK